MMRFTMMSSVALLCCFGAVSTAFAQADPLERRLVQLSVPPDGLLTGVSGRPGGTVQVFGPQILSGPTGDFYPESIIYNVRNIACRTAFYTPGLTLNQAANETYALYLTIGTSPAMKVQTFNTVCVEGGIAGFPLNGRFSSFAYLQGGDPNTTLPGLFTEAITIEVILQGAFGDDVVLRGTDPAP